MSQHIGSGRTLVGARRSFEADQTLQPLEAEFNAPAQTIKSENVGGFELSGGERGYHDNPVCGGEPLFRELIAFALGVPTRLASRLCCGLRRLPDGDQTRGEKRAGLAFDDDRPIDKTACPRLARFGDQAEGVTLAIEPPGWQASRSTGASDTAAPNWKYRRAQPTSPMPRSGADPSHQDSRPGSAAANRLR